MSRSCNFYLSILLASTFMSPAAAMDQTLTLPDYDFSLDTHLLQSLLLFPIHSKLPVCAS